MAWKITRNPQFNNCWNAWNDKREIVAGVRIETNGNAKRAYVLFPALPKFDWYWDFDSFDEAIAGGCAYVRGVERALEVN